MGSGCSPRIPYSLSLWEDAEPVFCSPAKSRWAVPSHCDSWRTVFKTTFPSTIGLPSVYRDPVLTQILPRQGYARLFTTMYATLVPTAGEREAEETANWEYGEDVSGLPLELGRAGIPLGAFSDALFAVADNVGEET